MELSATRWRIDPLEVGEPEALLEAGLAAFDRLARDPAPRLRWYRARRTAIVRGRGQRRLRLDEDDIPVITRHSGGGAVLLSPDVLSCDVLLPRDHPLARGTPADTALRVGAAWQAGLAALGVASLGLHDGAPTARRDTSRGRLLAEVCYATLAAGEVTADGRKLVGLAQRRRRHGVLVQCGLLRRWQPARLLRALGADPDDREIAAAAVGLDQLPGPPPDDAQVLAHVSAHLAAWPASPPPTTGDEPMSAAEQRA